MPVTDQLKPTSTEEVAECLKSLHATGTPVVPIGGRTHQHVGVEPVPGSVELDLSGLRGPVFHDPDDMVASFKAGTQLALMQAALGKHRQRIDLDPASPATTLGGAISVDHYGPRCHAWGNIRDKLLGMTYVLADGRIIRVGGKVMKNVSGYDLGRLMVGSLGTLGVITEVTLRLNPVYETQRTWLFTYPDVRDAWDAARAVLMSELTPTALCLLDYDAVSKLGSGAPDAGAFLLVAVEGMEEEVDYHQTRLPELLGTDPVTIMNERHSESLWERWQANQQDSGKAPFLLRCACRTGLFPRLLNVLNQANGITAYVGRGYMFMPARGIEQLETIRTAFENIGGYATVWKSDRTLDATQIWGNTRGDISIMRRLKAVHDPKNLLNRGRFYGGI